MMIKLFFLFIVLLKKIEKKRVLECCSLHICMKKIREENTRAKKGKEKKTKKYNILFMSYLLYEDESL